MSKRYMKILLPLLGLVALTCSAPAPTKAPSTPSPSEGEEKGPDAAQAPSTGLYYDQYLQKIVKLLESDESFRKTMENAKFDDIRDGKLSQEINKIPQDIRRQLDEAKKEEVTRLRKIMHAKNELEKGRKIGNTNYMKHVANHLDGGNPHTFEAADLTNLIKAATKDLENFDEKRHEEFKRYEMTKDLRRQEKLRQMTEEDRKKAEREYEEMKKKHEDHPTMNHPGSKAQMEEVWEEDDGLKDQQFNPKTFFKLHDINGDNSLDPMELEALFEKDLAKVYDAQNPEDDMFEMEAERTRMRQHVMKEVDLDGNGFISYEEFMTYTNQPKFDKPDEGSYKTVDQLIDDDEIYSKDELEEFRTMISEQEAEVKAKLDDLRKQAQAVVSLKSDVYQHERKMGPHPEEHEMIELEQKKEKMETEEKALKDLHEDLKEQSKEILEMKEELRKQENAVKLKEEGLGIAEEVPPPHDGAAGKLHEEGQFPPPHDGEPPVMGQGDAQLHDQAKQVEAQHMDREPVQH